MKRPPKGFKNQFRNVVKKLGSLFSKSKVESISLETKFQQRSSVRFSGLDFLLSMLTVSLDSEHATLERIASTLSRTNKITSVSAQAVMKRLNRSETTHFFKKLFDQALQERISNIAEDIPIQLLAPFGKVLIQDSTVFELNEQLQEFFKGSGGRASKSCGKLDVIYDIKSKNYEKIYLTDQSEADSSLAANINNFLEKGTLVIRDLGYLRADTLKEVFKRESYFLSRFKLNLLVYQGKNDSEQLDLAKYLSEQFENQEIVDMNVYITEQRIPVRMIAYKCPQEVVDKRRREARKTAKKQGRTLKKKTLLLMEFTIFITNVPREIWQSEVVGTIYRVRWQIELIFKSWKGGMKINYLKGVNRYRIESLIYVRLILLIVMNKIYQVLESLAYKMYTREVSMHKIHGWLREGERIINVFLGKLPSYEYRLLDKHILRSMCKQKRKRLTTQEMVQQGAFYSCNVELG